MNNAATLQKAKFTERLTLLLFIAWRNLWRNKTRSALTITALGGGLSMLILYASLLEGMVVQMSNFSTNISSGKIQIHRESFIEDQDLYATIPWELIKSLESKNPEVAIAPRLQAAGLGSVKDISSGVFIRAVDPEKEKHVTTMLAHIRQGTTDLTTVTKNEDDLTLFPVVVGAQFAKNMDLSPGDELVIISQAADGSVGNGLFTVSGILKPIELNFDRSGILMSIEAFQSLMYLESGAHELAIQFTDNQQLLSIQKQLKSDLLELENQFPLDIENDHLVTRNWKELVPAVSDMVEASKAAIYILGIIMIGLASLGMLNTMMMSIFERKHEFGILLSVGMGKYWLLFMVMLESFFIAVVSIIAGVSLGVASATYLEKHGIDMRGYMPDGFDYGGIIFEPIWYGSLRSEEVVISVILTMVIALIASLIPSFKIIRLKPVEALH